MDRGLAYLRNATESCQLLTGIRYAVIKVYTSMVGARVKLAYYREFDTRDVRENQLRLEVAHAQNISDRDFRLNLRTFAMSATDIN